MCKNVIIIHLFLGESEIIKKLQKEIYEKKLCSDASQDLFLKKLIFVAEIELPPEYFLNINNIDYISNQVSIKYQ